ncbi:MAG: hypothetical protein AAF941_03000 [Pseudomonadota bacterium]
MKHRYPATLLAAVGLFSLSACEQPVDENEGESAAPIDSTQPMVEEPLVIDEMPDSGTADPTLELDAAPDGVEPEALQPLPEAGSQEAPSEDSPEIDSTEADDQE